MGNAVLFVDDESNVLSSLRRGLMDADYRCLFASSGKEALKIMEETEISVIVTDMKMPEMNGLELLKKVKELYPDTVRMVLSGYTQLPQVLAAVNQGDIFKFVTKPWKLDEEFRPMIESAIEYYNLKKKSKDLQEELERKNEAYRKILETTQHKYDFFHQDINKIKQISGQIIDNIKHVMEKNGKQIELHEFIQVVDLHHRWLQGYLDTIPSKSVSFQLSKLHKELQQKLANHFDPSTFHIHMEASSDCTCEGNYRLYLYLLYVILDYILERNKDFSVPITIEAKEDSARFYVIVKSSPIKDMELFIRPLNEIAKQNKASFTLVRQEEEIYLTFVSHIIPEKGEPKDQ